MANIQELKLAEEFSALIGKETIAWQENYQTQFQAEIPFLYEAAFMNGLQALKPWEKPEQYVPEVMEKWDKLKEQIQKKISTHKQKEIAGMMQTAIAYFYELLFWCNHEPAHIHEEKVAALELKPINVSERLAFITSRPAHHHAYIQLSELFLELEKIFFKEQSRKKASKQ